ncbi:MAG: DUF2085 domain-containing protein, partial [Actinobacteria bacterium]
GHQLPVCARDTGIYLGFVACVLVIEALGRRRSEPPTLAVSGIGLALIGVMAFDGVTSYAGIRTTTNDIRLATGLMAGFGMALFAAPIVHAQLWRSPVRERVVSGPREVGLWLAALPAAFVVARWFLPLLGAGYAVLTAVCIVATFCWVNLAIVCLVPAFEGRAERLTDAWVALLLALALSALEIGASALFRIWITRLLT